MQKKVLNYFKIDNAPGGNQDWLPDWDMNKGGCGAVTACDVCINLAKYFPELYPFDLNNLSREDFIKFTNVMKPFLTPRYHGIDLLEIYINGFSDYLKSVNNTSLKIQGLAGTVNYKLAEKYIISQINSGIPVPFLLLRHENPEFEDFEWHWFNLAGYEILDDDLKVQTVTYGEELWVSLKELWDSGQTRKGGIIKIFNTCDNNKI